MYCTCGALMCFSNSLVGFVTMSHCPFLQWVQCFCQFPVPLALHACLCFEGVFCHSFCLCKLHFGGQFLLGCGKKYCDTYWWTHTFCTYTLITVSEFCHDFTKNVFSPFIPLQIYKTPLCRQGILSSQQAELLFPSLEELVVMHSQCLHALFIYLPFDNPQLWFVHHLVTFFSHFLTIFQTPLPSLSRPHSQTYLPHHLNTPAPSLLPLIVSF